MVEQTCAVCRAEAGQRCGGCQGIYYCGRAHQKHDWQRHKHSCRPFKVSQDAVVGRYLETTRPIRAGEVVLREGPLVRGPGQVTGPVCLSCLGALGPHDSEPCEHCGWPLHRQPTCRASASPHHLPECRWAMEKRKSPVKISHFSSPHPSYECIMALRMCYIKKHNPGTWAKLSALESHTAQRRGTHKYEEDTRSVAQFLARFYKLEAEFTVDEIMEIWGIVQVNGHEVPVTHPCHVAVYETASMLEHSCHPNCSKSFTAEGGLVVRAVQDIPRGSHLSICYTDALWGTVNRQCHLQETKFFSCKCVRCVDPTELGTYFSALLCATSGCGGPVLPPDLCTVSAESAWTCARCALSRPDSEVEALLHHAGEQLSSLGSKDVTASTTFLHKWGRVFHRNHYYLTEVRVALAQRLGQDTQRGVQDLSQAHLQLKTDLCRQLLELVPVIAPAECRLRGVLLFELHAGLAEGARRGAADFDVQQALLESRSCLEQTLFWLEQEPSVLPEGQLLMQARLNKAELDKTLQSVQWASSIPAM